MTDSKRSPSVGGRPVHRVLADSLPELVHTVKLRLTERLLEYAQLPPELLGGDVSTVIERSISEFIETVRTGAPTSAGLLTTLRESIAQRAGEGVPLDAILRAYHVGIEACWEHISDQARPADIDDVLEVNRLQLRYLQDLTAALSSGYVAELEATFGEQQAARQALLSALLNGDPVQEAASVAGVRLSPAYFVLGISIASHTDEHREGVNAVVAGRRKLRRMRAELERIVRDPVLAALHPGGGLVLVPRSTVAATDADWNWLRDTLSSSSHAAGVEFTVSALVAELSDVDSAAETAREALEVTVRSGRPPGMYRLADIALDYQLSLPGPARDELAKKLAPLADRAELLETLRTYFRTGLRRRRTAAELYVHPNTVDYRLRKITKLTGLDATAHGELPYVRAVLSAAAAERESTTNERPRPSTT